MSICSKVNWVAESIENTNNFFVVSITGWIGMEYGPTSVYCPLIGTGPYRLVRLVILTGGIGWFICIIMVEPVLKTLSMDILCQCF